MRSCDIILFIILMQLSFINCTQFCDNVNNKCNKGLKCLKKNEVISVCRKKCPIGWACYEETKSDPKEDLNISTISTEISNHTSEKNNSLTTPSETAETSIHTTVSPLTLTTNSTTESTKIIDNTTPSIIAILMTNITSLPQNSTNYTVNQCGSCPDEMNCFHVENLNYKCAKNCDPTWACNRTSNQTNIDEPLISEEEFNNAMTEAGYYIYSNKKYKYIVTLATTAGNITSKRELAMFLAQILWESDGLKAVREYACVNGCPNEYKTSDDVPGKSYYGRGYIQLTWAGNYKAASYDLFNDDRLYKNPDLVAEDEELSWATAFWYWKKHVKPRPGIELGYFGETTDAINGKLECFNGPNVHKAKLRFILYKKILRGLNINEEPIEKGCY